MAESRGERYYICVIGQISLVCEGRRKRDTEHRPGKWRKWEGEEGWGGGLCHWYVLSDKWVFTCLQPPPRCNKSWHLFVTYDCISDCLGCDSIPTPCSAGDGGIASLSNGEIEGFVAQMCRLLRYYICGRYGGCVCVGVCEEKKLECVQLICCLLLDVLDDV